MATMLIACAPAAHARGDARAGAPVALPYRTEGEIGPGCSEWRVQETGADIVLALNVGTRRIGGADGNVGRFGVQELAYCAPAAEHYTLEIDAPAHDATARAFAPRLATRRLRAGDAASAAWNALSAAFVELADARSARASGATFARAATLLDAAGEDESAASAWQIAANRAEFAIDRPLAQSAFDAARAHLQRLRRTRDEVVLLNDRALFLQASDPLQAKRLVERAFALQAPLRDARLSAVIENNVCLLRSQYGDLQAAEPCFARALATLERLHSPPASIGATRNNLAVVAYNRGSYETAASMLRTAADERRRGGDRSGYVNSIGNLALCLYQLGRLDDALRELHDAYAFASAGDDDVARARTAGYLGAMYLAWGDTPTAAAFAAEAETVYRQGAMFTDLAPALRLRAHIDADRGRLDEALTSVQEGWALALANDLPAAAANLAPVYADILLRRGDLAAAGAFIGTAKKRFATHEAINSLALRAAELRWLRASGRRREAEALAARLLAQARYPGVLRTSILIERYLLAVEGGAGDAARYRALLAEIGRDVAIAPDPQLALHLLDVARPAAEATIAAQLRACAAPAACAAAALRTARQFFALEAATLRGDEPGAGDDAELRGLLLALSAFEARNDVSVAAAQLRTRLAKLQSAARLRSPAAISACVDCAASDADADIVYFFGAGHGWRWQRGADGWRVHDVAPWPRIAGALEAFAEPARRRAALVDLSALVAGLAGASAQLSVGGDPRVSQIPFAALALDDGSAVVDGHAVRVRVFARAAAAAGNGAAAFWPAPAADGSALPMVATERAAVREWSRRRGVAFGSADDAGAPLALLHISAHGARDLGSGSAVLWLADRPVLSFLFGAHPVADTVVINACESGAAPAAGPAQASIAAGFLRAGARQVVATLFPVGDHAAARFSEVFYATFDPARDNLADAVRDAQRALRSIPSAGDAWAAYVALTAHD